jgi:hypothetical protein
MKRLEITTEMADGTLLESTTALPDFMLFERTAKKHGWSTTPSENPTVWEAFLGWASLRRMKLYDGTWEEFVGGAAVNVDARPPQKVDPTELEVGTG